MQLCFNCAKIRNFVFITIIVATQTLKSVSFQLPTPIVDTVLGAAAGGIGALSVYPIDFVKTQLQTKSGREKYPDGILSVPKIIDDEGGFFGLYKGVWVQLFGVAPEKAIKLSVNDIARSVLVSGGLPIPPVLGEILSGGIAGACQVVVTNPLEVTKVALQTSNMPFEQVWKEIGGFQGLYKGADACLLRDISFSLILFPIYSHAKEIIPELLGDSVPFPIVLFASGVLAAAPAAFMTTPFDIIKTRQQSLGETTINENENPAPLQYKEKETFIGNVANLPNSNFLPTKLNEKETGIATATATATISKPKIIFIKDEDKLVKDMDIQCSKSSDQSARNMNAIDIGKRLISEGDPAVFFSGGLERVARSSPQFGVTLALFDIFKSFAINQGILQGHL